MIKKLKPSHKHYFKIIDKEKPIRVSHSWDGHKKVLFECECVFCGKTEILDFLVDKRLFL